MKSKALAALAVVAATAALVACGGSSSNDGANGGAVTITVWHGQNQSAAKVFNKLVGEFNATHPKIHVDSQVGTLADGMLQKVTAALAGGKYPDMAFIFGPNVANLSRSPKALDLTDSVRDKATDEHGEVRREVLLATGVLVVVLTALVALGVRRKGR